MSQSCITLVTPSRDRCQLNRSQLHTEVEASGAARFKKSEEGRCMSCKMLVIPLSQPSDGCFYLFSTDECEQMFLRDSPLTSRDVDVSCRTFSACISCFTWRRRDVTDPVETTTGGVRSVRLMPQHGPDTLRGTSSFIQCVCFMHPGGSLLSGRRSVTAKLQKIHSRRTQNPPPLHLLSPNPAVIG